MDDTHPAARRVQIELLRNATPQRRLAMSLQLTDWVFRLSRAAIAKARPELSPLQQRLFFIEVQYGRQLAERVRAYLQRRNAE